MALRARALFVHDAEGRLTARNEPGGGPPPRLFLGRTRCGVLWRLAAGLPAPLVRELARLAAAERRVADPARDPERLAVLCARLEAEAPVETIWRGPAFRFPAQLPEPAGPGAAARRLAAPGALAEARAAFPHHTGLALRQPVVGVFAEGALASLCFAATGPGPAVEAAVETLPAFRGRGLAARAVAAWARAVCAESRIPLYSAGRESRASRRVAERLGLTTYGWTLWLR